MKTELNMSKQRKPRRNIPSPFSPLPPVKNPVPVRLSCMARSLRRLRKFLVRILGPQRHEERRAAELQANELTTDYTDYTDGDQGIFFIRVIRAIRGQTPSVKHADYG